MAYSAAMQSTKKTSQIGGWLPYAVSIASAVVAIATYQTVGVGGLTLYIALLLSLGLGWLAWRENADRHRLPSSDHPLELPFSIARDEDIFEQYQDIARALKNISQIPDPVFREAALQQIVALKSSLEQVAEGTLVFEGTESWRIVYEALLRSQHVFLYRSAAWAKSEQYWQDEPGKQSTQLNFKLVDEQALNIERIVILGDSVWPVDQRLPAEPILSWIEAHHRHGIWVKLVRESTVANEPDLLGDFGIYGSHAFGEQVLDVNCRTIRFYLRFNLNAVDEAEKRWKRLGIFTKSYRDLLDSME
jgi:hypothetical protein